MPTTLVAGATGYLGRYIVAELHRRGHTVRAIVRDRSRADVEGAYGAPGLDGLVDDWAVGNVTNAAFTQDVAAGVDHVVSALGVTRQKTDPWNIDNRANQSILASTLRHGASSFTYINALGADTCPAELTRAKTAFARALESADIRSTVINPSAYFSDAAELLTMAKRGLVPLFEPDIRLNPIHGADLAAYTVDQLEQGAVGSFDIGGPDILTWKELATTAFQAVGKKPRIVKVPGWTLPPVLGFVGLFNSRLADTIRFATWSMQHDCVAPTTGTHHIADFFREYAGR
ncbi:SDR family oxidoreductase [Corynebacterium durum]|uniref:SDR family oxidoreductase n=1 Tax=Corynebacterium durum TaxID=61592 RepID=UPI00389B2066